MQGVGKFEGLNPEELKKTFKEDCIKLFALLRCERLDLLHVHRIAG